MGKMTGKAIPDPIRAPNHDGPYCNGIISRVRRRAAGLPDHIDSEEPGEDWAGPGYCTHRAGQSTTHHGEGRCRAHDGRAWVGPSNPGYIDGRATRLEKYLPNRYKEGYAEALDDPLVQREHAEQLAIIDRMQIETLKRFDTSESGEAWKRVCQSAKACRGIEAEMGSAREIENLELYTAKRDELLAHVLHDLLPSIETGAREDEARDELVRLFKDRASLMKVKAASERMVPIELLGLVLIKSVHIVAEEVDDPRTISRVADRLRREPIPGIEDVLEASGRASKRSSSHAASDDGTIDVTPRGATTSKRAKSKARGRSKG